MEINILQNHIFFVIDTILCVNYKIIETNTVFITCTYGKMINGNLFNI